ncbi:MAG: efflux RND transporter periplasmic adaptor subunit [Candidatus Sedimenticola sp. (ex Thyasira tokunagai)]
MIKRWIVAVMMSGGFTLAMADDVEGHLGWLKRVELGTPLSGRISRVEVQPGDRVKAGGVLVALDERRYAAQLSAAKARVEAARQEKLEADKELERTLDLFDRTVLSEHDRNLAEIAAAGAAAQWRHAQAALVEAQSNLDDCRVIAPFDGVVIKVDAIPGATTVNRLQLQSLVALADDSGLLVHGEVTPEQAAGLTVGGEVEVAVNAIWHPGKVQHVGLEPVSSSTKVRYKLTVRIDGADQLKPRSGGPAVIRF